MKTRRSLLPASLLLLALGLPGPGLAEGPGRIRYAVTVGDPHPGELPTEEPQTTLRSFHEHAQAWLRELGYEILPADSREEVPALTGLVTLTPQDPAEAHTSEDEESPFRSRMSLRWLARNGEILATSRLQTQGEGEIILARLLDTMKEDLGPVLSAGNPRQWINLEIQSVGFGGYPSLKKALLDIPEVSEVYMREATPETAQWVLRSSLKRDELMKRLHGLAFGKQVAKVTALGLDTVQLSPAKVTPTEKEEE